MAHLRLLMHTTDLLRIIRLRLAEAAEAAPHCTPPPQFLVHDAEIDACRAGPWRAMVEQDDNTGAWNMRYLGLRNNGKNVTDPTRPWNLSMVEFNDDMKDRCARVSLPSSVRSKEQWCSALTNLLEALSCDSARRFSMQDQTRWELPADYYTAGASTGTPMRPFHEMGCVPVMVWLGRLSPDPEQQQQKRPRSQQAAAPQAQWWPPPQYSWQAAAAAAQTQAYARHSSSCWPAGGWTSPCGW